MRSKGKRFIALKVAGIGFIVGVLITIGQEIADPSHLAKSWSRMFANVLAATGLVAVLSFGWFRYLARKAVDRRRPVFLCAEPAQEASERLTDDMAAKSGHLANTTAPDMKEYDLRNLAQAG